jgi:hypothetical protein
MVVLIADAPPHGVSVALFLPPSYSANFLDRGIWLASSSSAAASSEICAGDGFAQGSPDGHDPLQLVRQMKSRGITLFMVACEPALSGYTYSTDFFRGLCQISSGAMLPLTNASLLAHVIVGSALEQMNMRVRRLPYCLC